MTKLVAAVALLVAAGCGGSSSSARVESSPWLTPAGGAPDATSGTRLERFFPLLDGMVYSYVTQNEVGEEGMLVARVHRLDAGHGELRFPNGTKRFEYRPDGVVQASREGTTYVLKAPLEPNASWRGEHGGSTRVLKVDADADVPAGRFTGCVVTLEERLGDRPIRYATTFCPEVGVVMLEAATGANFERAVLKSYAAPVKLPSDGVDRTQVSPGPPPPP